MFAPARRCEEIEGDRPSSRSVLAVEPGRWRDVASIFNLIQTGSTQGHFNPVYLQPRYQAGLASQLFGIVLTGRIRLPDKVRRPARIHVVRKAATAIGFAIVVTHSEYGEVPAIHELYMCALHDDAQGVGVGKQMLRSVLNDLPISATVYADCLPPAKVMKRLLMGLKFKPGASGRTQWQRWTLHRGAETALRR